MLLLVLLGCADQMRTPSGADYVRGAVWLDVEQTALLGFSEGEVALGLVLNSVFPCEPEDVNDDPSTEHLDEVAMARTYWDAQLYSALQREGAFVAGFLLYREPDEPWGGTWPVHEDTLFDPAPRVEDGEGRAAAAFWYHVTESGVEDRDEVLLANVATAYEADFRVAAPGFIEVESHTDDELAGSFDFWPADASGDFHAEHCTSDDLEGKILAYLFELGIF